MRPINAPRSVPETDLENINAEQLVLHAALFEKYSALPNAVDFGANVQEALDWPRFHYIEGPGVALEEEIPEATRTGLAALGHRLEPALAALARGGFGGGQGIQIERASGVYWGGSDRRKDGCAIGC